MYKVPKWYQWYTYVSTFSELFNNINPVDELMLVIDHLDDQWLPEINNWFIWSPYSSNDLKFHILSEVQSYYVQLEIFIIMQYATYLICVWYQMIYHTLYVCSRMYSSIGPFSTIMKIFCTVPQGYEYGIDSLDYCVSEDIFLTRLIRAAIHIR